MNRTAFYNTVREFFGKISAKQVNGFEEILAATEHLPITHRAYLLATAWHETARTMQPIRERGSGDGPDPDSYDDYLQKYDTGRLAKALGNTPEADGDGVRYAGRGYVQITGLANYKKASALTGLDLVGNPELALQPSVAAKILVEGCARGIFTGKKLSDFIPGDYRNARRVVNGTDKADMIAVYAARFESALVKAGAVAQPKRQPTGNAVFVTGLVAAVFTAVASFFEEIKAAIASLFGG